MVIRSVSARSNAGFTLIELIVVTAIMVLVTSLILANNTRFGGIILLENLAYDIALTIRQTQVYGISVHRFGTDADTYTYRAGYGMHFSTENEASLTTYYMFADVFPSPNGNGLYDEGEIVGSPFAINKGYHFAKLCSPAGADAATCSPVSQLDILFKRPEPDAYISINGAPLVFDGNGHISGGSPQESARIVVESPRGDKMSVIVEDTGQISVRQ